MAVLTSVVLWAETEDFFCQEANLKSLSMHPFLPILSREPKFNCQFAIPKKLTPPHTFVVGPKFISVGAADFGKIGGWRWRVGFVYNSTHKLHSGYSPDTFALLRCARKNWTSHRFCKTVVSLCHHRRRRTRSIRRKRGGEGKFEEGRA